MGIITKGMGAILKSKKFNPKQKKINKIRAQALGVGVVGAGIVAAGVQKIKKAPPKQRIEISGHGKMGEMVTPKQDLIEDYEILRDKISRGKK